MESEIVAPTWSLATPLGTMIASATEGGICRLMFTPDGPRMPSSAASRDDRRTGLSTPGGGRSGHERHLVQLEQELAAYFRGDLRSFTLPIDLRGTRFQERVWELVLQIPYGETIAYGALARRLGDLRVVRSVARANALNPLAIIVPCHRVIGANGTLTGYAGGLWRKRRLLQLEATGSIEDPQAGLFRNL